MKLKQILITAFIILSYINAQGQFGFLQEEWEDGHCYAIQLLAQQHDSIKQDGARYFKITLPVWETKRDTFSGKIGETFRVKVREKNRAFVLNETYNSSEVGAAPGTYMVICLQEQPAQYQNLSFKENDTIKIVECQLLVKPSELVELTDAYPLELEIDPKQSYAALEDGKYLRYFKLAAGNWSEGQKAFKGCTIGSSSSSFVKQVQEKLNIFCYDIPVTNVLDRQTKSAIVDFQKKMKLPVGQIDIELLRTLGINY